MVFDVVDRKKLKCKRILKNQTNNKTNYLKNTKAKQGILTFGLSR